MNKAPFNSIQSTIQRQGWAGLLLAVSGGLDSICLAHYFIQKKTILGLKWLGIAHVHHGLREGTADLDAELVRKFAENHNVPFFMERLNGEALKSNGSVEENAREARYAFLSCIAKENNAAIVTAHHAGDQAETLYMRLRRGVTLAGLRGMQEVRDDATTVNASAPIYRPFLNVTREELLAYAKENHLTWREDESNADTKYTRNLVRHELLPNLEKKAPGATSQLTRIAAVADRAYEKILQQAERQFAPAIIPSDQWPFDAKYATYEKVLALDEKKIPSFSNMAELFRLWLDAKGFRFPVDTFLPKKSPTTGTSLPQHLSSFSINLSSVRYRTRFIEKCRHIIWICDRHSTLPPKNLYLVEEQKFSGVAGEWRIQKEGDILWPLDDKIRARKLEKWLNEQGIPKWMHGSLPLFAQGSRILYVQGARKKQV